MLFLFGTLLSCTALKLSDPVALRDVVEENVSLRSWCTGVGCVMPFTPASCLSWCDWNVDKQADAEARGAFANGKTWGKNQVKATTFNIEMSQVKIGATAGNKDGATGTVCDVDKKRTFYFQAADEGGDCGHDCKTSAPIFPGGDGEAKFSETSLACSRCYKLSDGEAKTDENEDKFNDNAGIATHYYLKFSQGASADDPPLMTLYWPTSKKCKGINTFNTRLLANMGRGDGTKQTRDPKTGKKIEPTRVPLAVMESHSTNVVGGNKGNQALAASYCFSFSGTAIGGVVSPKACKDEKA